MRSDIENAIRTAAAEDPAFRAALIADPAAALEQRFGTAVPAGIRLHVVEERPDEVTLVLPATESATLSEAQLEAVSGGYPKVNFP